MFRSPLRHWSPTAILAAGLMVAIAFTSITLSVALRQPWLGLTLTPAGDQPGLRVKHAQGPARGIAPGTRLLTLGSDRAGTLALHEGNLTPEPDTTYPRLSDYRTFLKEQDALALHMKHATVILQDASGAMHRITPAPQRPLGTLPLTFWLQWVVAISGFLVGLSVWTFRRSDRAAVYLFVTGMGLMLSAGSAAVYSSRELALPAALFDYLHQLNGIGSLLFCAAFVATLWHYPTRLGRLDPGPALIAVFLAIAGAGALGWLSSFDIVLRLPILTGFCATIVLAIVQWRRTRQRPLERAALQWFLLAWFSGSTFFLALVFVPVLFGVDTGALQAYAFTLFLLIYLGLAFGIVRYRLFQLEQWWLNAWSFLLLIALLMASSLLLTSLLHSDPLITICLAVAATGWLYLPLRHWLAHRRAPASLDTTLPQVLQHVIASGATIPHQLWHDSLIRLFRPLNIRQLPGIQSKAKIGDDGLLLTVPDLQGTHHLQLVGCEGGTRLFNQHDQVTGDTMHSLIQRLADFGRAVQIGVEQERLRVSRDLHDDLGARLLDLLHRSEGAMQDRVRAVLDELRLVTTSLGSRGEHLEDFLGVCRAETAERLEGSVTTLQWQQPDPVPDIQLDPHQAMLIVRALREGIANIQRHAQARSVVVEIHCHADEIILRLHNDGVSSQPIADTQGHSLMALQGRAAALGGQLIARAEHADGWLLELRLPHDLPD